MSDPKKTIKPHDRLASLKLYPHLLKLLNVIKKDKKGGKELFDKVDADESTKLAHDAPHKDYQRACNAIQNHLFPYPDLVKRAYYELKKLKLEADEKLKLEADKKLKLEADKKLKAKPELSQAEKLSSLEKQFASNFAELPANDVPEDGVFSASLELSKEDVPDLKDQVMTTGMDIAEKVSDSLMPTPGKLVPTI